MNQPPAIEDIAPIQDEMGIEIAALYKALEEGAKKQLPPDALRDILTLIQVIQKERDNLLRHCERKELTETNFNRRVTTVRLEEPIEQIINDYQRSIFSQPNFLSRYDSHMR